MKGKHNMHVLYIVGGVVGLFALSVTVAMSVTGRIYDVLETYAGKR